MIRRERAARGHLARLVAVIAVLVGVVLMHGVQCTDDMTGVYSDGGVEMVQQHGVHPAMTTVYDHDSGPAGSDGLGGMLVTCLAFVVVVVAAVAGLRPAGFQGFDRVISAARTARAVIALPRAPSLAELCLLRT